MAGRVKARTVGLITTKQPHPLPCAAMRVPLVAVGVGWEYFYSVGNV